MYVCVCDSSNVKVSYSRNVQFFAQSAKCIGSLYNSQVRQILQLLLSN